ncbi:DUF3040 domain-containing protein [Kibdelosporangium aridum]|uniref:DUF3040 domain-containing protein n=1 Tax=Kibdelosporangium aridum TaxID=2030 RepID=A0A428ZDY5_KIBAR|nr:DUF3040 domain-containing protein [Kibdelosporangium aridum]RSM86303.1 DUF3040 domain-containing protein [Kibdelosporangium aridum]
MALRDEEQRKLAEIERGLAAEDPRLASQFTERPKLRTGTIAEIAVMLMAGSVMAGVGVQLGSAVLIVIGGIVATIVPIMIAARL